MKNETKKLLEVVGNAKKTAAGNASKQLLDITKLSEEIASLKDGRNLLEKKLRCCTCPSVVKGVKKSTSGDVKVDQITATAKAEIQKLVRGNFVRFHDRS